MNVSIAQMLEKLEAQIERHRSQQELHAEKEAFHRDQKAFHEAELATARERFEAFRAAATAAGEFVDRHEPGAMSAQAPEDREPGRRVAISHLIGRLVAARAPGETFGASVIVQEIRERWGSKLRRRVDQRSVAATLRRWAARGRLHLVRDGRAYYESLYCKPPAPEPAGRSKE